MTASSFFPDNTVLINFDSVSRWDLLRKLIQGQGLWCASVADECRASQDHGRRPALFTNASFIFNQPIQPDPSELRQTRIIRDSLASPGEDNLRRHLGEAETIAVVQNRFASGVFLTDDHQASVAAQGAGIACYGTGDLLKLCVRRGLLAEADRYGIEDDLARERRAVQYLHSEP